MLHSSMLVVNKINGQIGYVGLHIITKQVANSIRLSNPSIALLMHLHNSLVMSLLSRKSPQKGKIPLACSATIPFHGPHCNAGGAQTCSICSVFPRNGGLTDRVHGIVPCASVPISAEPPATLHLMKPCLTTWFLPSYPLMMPAKPEY